QVEVIETLAPVRFRRRELRADSGGAGRYRGGLGQTMEFGLTTGRPFMFSGLYERLRHPASGLAGGRPGGAGALASNNGTTVPAKETVTMPAETVVTLHLPGGGGFGDPRGRDADLVRDDVRLGLVGIAAARELYGVVL